MAMTTKILTKNGQVLLISMYILLIPDEIAEKDGIDVQEQFMARVHEKMGS